VLDVEGGLVYGDGDFVECGLVWLSLWYVDYAYVDFDD